MKRNSPSKKDGKSFDKNGKPLKSRAERGYTPFDDLIKGRKSRKYKKEYKTSAKQRLKTNYRYYEKKIEMHINKILHSATLSRDDSRMLTNVLRNIRTTIFFTIKMIEIDEKIYQCIIDKLRDMDLFLKRMESVGYNIGRYLRDYGFHKDFLPEESFMHSDSLKIVETIQNFENYLNSCFNQ